MPTELVDTAPTQGLGPEEVLLDRRVDFVVHHHAPSVTVQDAEANLDFPVERLLKTIAFRVKNGGWVLAGILGYGRVDYRRLGDAVGVNRTQLMPLSPEEVEQQLGYVIGGVAPFAPNERTQVILDDAILRHATIFCGTGRTDRTLEIVPAELIAASGALVASIAKKATCEG